MPKTDAEKSADAKRKRNNQHSNPPSITGQVFGKWTVGEGSLTQFGNRKHTVYMCTCVCGAVQEVRYSRLKNGTSTQCATCKLKRPICVRGHNTAEYGRSPKGDCRVCAKERNLEQKYGMSLVDYKRLYDFQEGKCAICGRKLAFMKVQDKQCVDGRPEVDHEHVPKKQKIKPSKISTVRGLLCGGRWAGCNAKLGHVDKQPWLKAALAYIENPPARQLFGKVK